MPDANIKKVVIPKSELPAVNGQTSTYNLRYRVISEDKNRVSHWSKVYNVSANPIATIPYTTSVSNSNKLITCVWTPDASLGISSYDVYAKWVGNSPESQYAWQYVDTTSVNNYSFVFPTTITTPLGGTENPKKIIIAVQRPTYPKEKENYPTVSSVTLFETTLITL